MVGGCPRLALDLPPPRGRWVSSTCPPGKSRGSSWSVGVLDLTPHLPTCPWSVGVLDIPVDLPSSTCPRLAPLSRGRWVSSTYRSQDFGRRDGAAWKSDGSSWSVGVLDIPGKSDGSSWSVGVLDIPGSVIPESDWSILAPSASSESLSFFEIMPRCRGNWNTLRRRSSNPRRLG